MYPKMFPAEPSVELYINGNRIGLLQEYSVTTETAVHPLRSFGSSKPTALHPGEVSYTVTLKRLLLDRPELQPQFSPYGLKDFVLEIHEQQRLLSFRGCQWTRLKENYSLGQTLLEEMVLLATDCNTSSLV